MINNRLKALELLADYLIYEVKGLSKDIEALTDSPAEPQSGFQKINLPQEVLDYEISLIRNALVRTGGRQNQAAEELGLKATTLNEKIKRFGLLQMNVVAARARPRRLSKSSVARSNDQGLITQTSQ